LKNSARQRECSRANVVSSDQADGGAQSTATAVPSGTERSIQDRSSVLLEGGTSDASAISRAASELRPRRIAATIPTWRSRIDERRGISKRQRPSATPTYNSRSMTW
jgi:hypothetical protein